MQLQQGPLALQFEFVPELVELTKVGGEHRVLAVPEPVWRASPIPCPQEPCFASPRDSSRSRLRARCHGVATRQRGWTVRSPSRITDAELSQVAGFPDQGRRVDDDVRAEVGAGRFGCRERAGPELGEGVAPAVRQLDVVARLAAAAVPDDKVGF